MQSSMASTCAKKRNQSKDSGLNLPKQMSIPSENQAKYKKNN